MVRERLRVEGGRNPKLLVVSRVVERRRHHPDDGVGLSVQPQGAAQNIRLAAELRSPEAIAQDDDVSGAGVVFFGPEHPAQPRLHAEDAEEVLGDTRTGHALRRIVFGQVEAGIADRS